LPTLVLVLVLLSVVLVLAIVVLVFLGLEAWDLVNITEKEMI